MRQSGAKQKKNPKQSPFNSCGRRSKPPVFVSSADYGFSFSPGAGQAPPPQPPLKKEREGPVIIIVIIITTAPAWRQEGEEHITPAAIIAAVFITAATVITTPTLPLQGEPPIL